MKAKRAASVRWTDEERAILRLCTRDRYGAEAIARCLTDRTPGAVYAMRHFLGLRASRFERDTMGRDVIQHYRALARNPRPKLAAMG